MWLTVSTLTKEDPQNNSFTLYKITFNNSRICHFAQYNVIMLPH
jgi:hypothetical protein